MWPPLPEPELDNCRAKVLLVLPEVAVSVAVCDEVTAATVALKPALVDPEATATLDGTVTEELELDSDTLKPPLGAAPLNVTVHESLPAAV